MKSVFFSGTAMPSKKCYHSSSESWHMICRRNPPPPCLAPRCFSTIIVRHHLLLATAILPVSSRCLTPCALAMLASVIIFHALLPSSASAGTSLINIEQSHQSRLAITCRPQHDYGLPPKAYVYLHLALVLSPDREAFLPSVPRDTH